MKKFIRKIMVLFLPFGILSLPLDIYVSTQLRKSHINGDIEVWNDIYDGKAGCEIAIYGSSRATRHINPLILEDSLNQTGYNFGIDGHHFEMQYFRHTEFTKYNQPPKTIILSVDIFSLGRRYDLYNSQQFLPFMFWNKTVYEYTSDYKGYSSLDYFVPLIRYIGNGEIIHSLIKNQNSPQINQKGFKGMERTWSDDFVKAKMGKDKYVIQYDAATISLFHQFIKECKDTGTELILLYTPEYIDGQNFVENRNVLIDLYKNIAQEYDLLYLDYSDDELCYQKDFFYNGEHLNSKGADLFTKKLASDLKKLRAE
jgi:hypothetical protein